MATTLKTYATHTYAPIKIGATWYSVVTFADTSNPLAVKPDTSTVTFKTCKGGIRKIMAEGTGLTVTLANGVVSVLITLTPADTEELKAGVFNMLVTLTWSNPTRVVYPLEAVFTIEEKF